MTLLSAGKTHIIGRLLLVKVLYMAVHVNIIRIFKRT